MGGEHSCGLNCVFPKPEVAVPTPLHCRMRSYLEMRSLQDGIHQAEVRREWGVPRPTRLLRRQTHREGRGGSTQGSWRPREASGERNGRILSPGASFTARVGGLSDTLTSDFDAPDPRDSKSLLFWATQHVARCYSGPGGQTQP